VAGRPIASLSGKSAIEFSAPNSSGPQGAPLVLGEWLRPSCKRMRGQVDGIVKKVRVMCANEGERGARGGGLRAGRPPAGAPIAGLRPAVGRSTNSPFG
jgi:hypothetical protein